ncbi:amino acid adenylation domain-containing protein [Streptomyces sp. NPDC001985]|uniref:non-ribosomal peptide synthetase family protein n=1 Tax=Streptomyces sp. NPDC001985 TaxID=3154406 RepID=UPI00332820C1
MKNLSADQSGEPTHLIGDDLATLPGLLRERAQSQPEAVAVVHEDGILTRRELSDRSTAVGHQLWRMGVRSDDRVGVFMEPSADLMAGVWGILSSGGAYLPLSPEYPDERLRYMVEDARAAVVLTQESLRSRLEDLVPVGTRVVTFRDLENFTASWPGSGERSAPVPFLPGRLAYVIHTSGSTGKPKGVMIEHRGVVSQLRWLASVHGIGDGSVVLQKTPLSFDAAQWEILAPACGGTVVMGAHGVQRDPDRLIDTVVRHGVTVLQGVPTLLQALVDTEGFTRCTSLRRIFSGGEALSRDLAQRCLDALPGCELVNLYGPTECTINSASFTVDRATIAEGPQAIPIGRPADGTELHILDRSGAPVAAGEIGELYIGGVQLARGYLGRPELTAERFVEVPALPGVRLYRSGDLAHWNDDGTVQFAGRADSQVKLRGFRVELDEIRLAIETHSWVKNAAVVVKDDSVTGFRRLLAFVELSAREAALMDQGQNGDHHRSKADRRQVRAQLSNAGCREPGEIEGRPAVRLPGAEARPGQRRRAFARKTYRFYEGGDIRRADLLALLGPRVRGAGRSREPGALGLDDLGRILRDFGQHLSAERLLPKYAYASPGSLYATQLHLELNGVAGLEPGYYYYHPLLHRLILIRAGTERSGTRCAVHLIGRRKAIEAVYRDNVREVLEIEAGHMIGLFEEILPAEGLDITAGAHTPDVRNQLECSEDDYYLGTFDLVPHGTVPHRDPYDIYVQTHPGRVPDLPAGQYRYAEGDLQRLSDDLILKKHVIAINQRVYERASFGISIVARSNDPRTHYVDLGRKLQHLQMNGLGLGFMSSGYSSRTGNDLMSAVRLAKILDRAGAEAGPSYFCVGGRVSDEQIRGEGMKEDTVHMTGPAELIREDLVTFLPDYMLPNRVVVVDRLPLTANGKVDVRALAAREDGNPGQGRVFTAPRTRTEETVRDIFSAVLGREGLSVRDDFFEAGGNSLIALRLVAAVNKEFGSSLPLQVVFTSPTVEAIARLLEGDDEIPASRLVRLQGRGAANPVLCWPGLGGYTMNLRPLAGLLGAERPFYGVQAHGINGSETPFRTLGEMAAEDIRAIKRLQPEGPYTLWGYSFGARTAFETAYRLEQAGDRVDHLFLIAPGSPGLETAPTATAGRSGDYRDPAYVTILFSVFAGTVTGPLLTECLRASADEDSFVSFVTGHFPGLDAEPVRRIIRIVELTYSFTYEFHELRERRISAPVTLFKARGDDYSFIENSAAYSAEPPTVVELGADHYGILRSPGVDELARRIRERLAPGRPA